MTTAALQLVRQALQDDPELGIARTPTQTRVALLAALAAITRAGSRNMNPIVALKAREHAGEKVADAHRQRVALLVRAAQDPAMTDVPGWAEELTRTIVADWINLLGEQGGLVARLPLPRFDLNGNALKVPVRADNDATLAGAFRGEGAPIRVGRLTLNAAMLTGKSMGVIATATQEMIGAANDGAMLAVIREGAVSDSAIALDRAFFDDVAGDDIRPAGIQNGIDPADTAVSSGTTNAAINADMRARVKQLHARGLGGASTVWAMHSELAASIYAMSDEARLRDRYLGIPIVSGLSLPPDVVFLIDCGAIPFASNPPTIDSSTEAVVHEEDGAPNTDEKTGATVLPIVDGAGVAATPVRSLFQTHATGTKVVWEVDWQVVRPGAVQTITGVAW